MNHPASLTPSSSARTPSRGPGISSHRWLWALLAFFAGALLVACASNWDYVWKHADELFNGENKSNDYGFGSSSSDDLPHFTLDDESDDRDRR